MAAPTTLQGCLQRRDFPAMIKLLDAHLQQEEGLPETADRVGLLVNRGACLQQLGLYRKALTDYDQVLAVAPGHATALLNRAKVLVGLSQLTAAKEALQQFTDSAGLSTDLGVVMHAQELLQGLEEGAVPAGAKLPPSAFSRALPPKAAAAPPVPSQPSAVTTQEAATQAESPAGGTPPAPVANAASNAHGAVAAVPRAAKAVAAPPVVPTTPPARVAAPSSQPMEPMHRLLAVSDPNAAVAVAVGLVNSGKCKEATAMLDTVLHRHPGNVSALAARGTGRALLGDLKGAIDDFSAAIAVEPRLHDFYKRRAQALAASGEDAAALEDLGKAVELAPDGATAADALADSAKIRSKLRDYRRAEADVRGALQLAPSSLPLLSLLASCQVSQGDLAEGIATYQQVLQATPNDKDIVLNVGMALKEMSKVKEAGETLRQAAQLGRGSPVEATARKLLAQMLQGQGDHLGAAKELTRALTATQNVPQRIELRLLRGACYHAVGMHREAVEDYQSTLEAQTPEMAPEAVSNLCLAFYQKEMALWARAHLNDPLARLCVDADFSPEFKELWCKKGPPSGEFVNSYRNVMQPQHPNWAAAKPSPPPPDKLKALLAAADALGSLVQYTHQGFLPNRRQQRMAGLAAIEFAQLLQRAAAARRAGKALLIPDEGASACARGPSGIGGGGRGKASKSHRLGWRDAMDVIVKWRQLSEPNDQVLWVDLLTEREFSSGFGSHTPMFTGQTKCVRYYMNFARAMEVAKRVALAEGGAYDAESRRLAVAGEAARAAVVAAQSAEDFWRALGRDCWVVVPIASSCREGHHLEGTRLTVVKLDKEGRAGAAPVEAAAELASNGGDAEAMAQLTLANGVEGAARAKAVAATAAAQQGAARSSLQPDAYEFSIRTPVTPGRWEDFDAELSEVFNRLLAAMATQDLPAVSDAALRFAYYWYNFMPLARGSAMCGYVSLLGVFLAAGMPVRATMPPGYQTDWEAILESTPEAFIASVDAWMRPPELAQGPAPEGVPLPPCSPLAELPGVEDTLRTVRDRLEALNGPGVPRL